MRVSEETINSVLSNFSSVTDSLVQSSNLLKNESIGIKADVGEALVQLQFQDRVSQIMSHVKNNIELMPEFLANNYHYFQQHQILQALEPALLLTELEKTYAMSDEHEIHSSGAVKKQQEAQSDDLTFF